jgi:AmmeMemoRadiSam system protein B/AmmeMemoRadiSam system protein A
MKNATNQNASVPAPEKKVIDSQLAGSWYTSSRARLAEELKEYLAQASEAPVSDHVIALISPHAGYRFSGPVAGYGMNQIAGKTFTRVIVMGPSHHVAMPNKVSIPSATHYSTPLGEISLDTTMIQRLRKDRHFQDLPEVVSGENSVEIQLPFLQVALGSFQLIPVYVGQLDLESAKAIAEALRVAIDEKTLIVASSDFTHYGPNYRYLPFTSNVQANLEKLDMGAVQEIEKKSPSGFVAYCEKTGATICGQDPITILLNLLPADAKYHFLKYDTSGRMTGDSNNSVSYVSVAFTGQWPKNAQGAALSESQNDKTLTEADKTNLLKLARKTLEYAFKNKRRPSPQDLGITITPAMKAVMGAFVTLNENGELRGCIGEIFPRRALYEAVMDHALNSALNDTRFMPVTEDEVSKLVFEISALTPPKPVDSYKDIILGKHGMVLSKNGHSAVFLPQVAPEQGWDLAQTLTHLSMKAGLPSDAWKEGAKYTVFEAIVFSEDEKK